MGMAILISDNTDFKREHYWSYKVAFYQIKQSINQEDITIIKVQLPNTFFPKAHGQIYRKIYKLVHRTSILKTKTTIKTDDIKI